MISSFCKGLFSFRKHTFAKFRMFMAAQVMLNENNREKQQHVNIWMDGWMDGY